MIMIANDFDGDGDGDGDGDVVKDFHPSLVCLHYLALLLLELRHQGQPQFYIKVTFLIEFSHYLTIIPP